MSSYDSGTCARAIVANVCERETAAVESGDRLDDLGLDSLDRVLLAVLVERACGRVMPDAVLAAATTVADIERHMLGSRAAA